MRFHPAIFLAADTETGGGAFPSATSEDRASANNAITGAPVTIPNPAPVGGVVKIDATNDPIANAQVDPAAIQELIGHVRDPFLDALASVTGQGRNEMVRFADYILPELARLELIAQYAPDDSLKALAARKILHLRAQSIASAGTYGVSIIQSSQKAALAAINTVFIFGRRFIGVV